MKFFGRRRYLLLLFVFQCVVFYFFSKIKGIVHLLEQFSEWKKNFHIRIFSWINFSVGDIFYLFLIGYLLFLVFHIFRSRKALFFQIQLLLLLNIFYLVYQICWGMYYFQPPISEKLPKKELKIERLKQLTFKYLHLSKLEREKVKQDKNGIFVLTDIVSLQEEIIRVQKYLPKQIITKKPLLHQSIKPSLLAKYANFSGISGYYNPFTAEAQYHAGLPHTSIPFTISHEVAHQMGYAREQEANFLAYLVGIHSQNSELRYSTYYFVLKSLLHSLRDTEPAFIQEILNLYSPAMQRDRVYEIAYRKQNEGFIDEILYFTNDIFLKTNQQEGSITYSYFLDLLYQYEEN